MRWLIVPGLILLLAACQSSPTNTDFNALPSGDAGRGATIFNAIHDGAPSCSTCHLLEGRGGAGPSLAGFGTVAGTRVRGQSAEEYIYTSIVRPARHIVQGYSNIMYNSYDEKLSAQQIADLIAFLLAQ